MAGKWTGERRFALNPVVVRSRKEKRLQWIGGQAFGKRGKDSGVRRPL